MGQNVAAFSGADGNGDGTIDQGDYDFWRARFGNSLPAASAAVAESQRVPEPGTVILMLAGAALLACTPKRAGRQAIVRRARNRAGL
jgi:hypothetical protein